jgi:predicted nucleotidyltransferase
MYCSKDFIETNEGLIFAVVAQGSENGKVLCFLRYIKRDFRWVKVSTEQANAFLEQNYPDYLHYSSVLDAYLHAVVIEKILKHHRPKQRLQEILMKKQSDIIEDDLFQLCVLLQKAGLDLSEMGVTGSLLVGVQKKGSDIDLICYQRHVFHQCRFIIRDLIQQDKLQELNDNDWWESYQRRSCDLSLMEYVWHEKRKTNKAIINGRKFDLNFVDNLLHTPAINYQKCGAITLQCIITDDIHAFDYPAEFKTDHECYGTIVSFSATYTGQATKGETVEVSGLVEQTKEGLKRIVVGSSREAPGEYIKVIRA